MMTREEKILALKIERMNLLEKYEFDRSNSELVKKEKELLKQIEELSK